VGESNRVPVNTYLKILAMMDQLSSEDLDVIFRDIKQIVDSKVQPAQIATAESVAFSANGTGSHLTASSLDKDETHPTKPK
jgi:hypothetical protein